MTIAAPSWSGEDVDRLCAMLGQGLNGRTISERLGIGRGSVRGQIQRMQANGDPRVAQVQKRGRKGSAAVRAEINNLAKAVADGAPSIAAAGRSIGLTQQRADQYWLSIRRGLGRQAI